MKKKEAFTQGLAQILVKNKVLDVNDAQSLQEMFKNSTKETFDEFLLEEGLVETPDLLKALSQYYQLPSFDVVGYFFDHNLITKFPKGFLLRSGIIPLEVDQNMLIVVASNPDESGLESTIRDYVSYDVHFMVGINRNINDMVKEFYDAAPSAVQEDVDLRQERRLEHDVESELGAIAENLLD
ncbi:hypothetical protein KAH94_00545 [bacterium]|nr:hypothetical protein [bacterium]